MTLSPISSYSKEELQEVLRIMRDYRSACKQIGSRAKIMDNHLPIEKKLTVEYAPLPQKEKELFQGILEKFVFHIFPEAKNKNIHYRQNSKMKGGAYIFYGDDMVDVSFDHIERIFSPAFSNF